MEYPIAPPLGESECHTIKEGVMQYQQKETNTIFIVEDDNANGALLTEIILQETSCHALLLINAGQVLKVVQHQRPLLFVLDYYLPDMNGIELHDQLQVIEGLQGVPMLIIGASLETHEKEIKKRGLVALAKPFELEDFLATIETLLDANIRRAELSASIYQHEQLI
jgi:DNA-binding NtrC family response regulator